MGDEYLKIYTRIYLFIYWTILELQAFYHNIISMYMYSVVMRRNVTIYIPCVNISIRAYHELYSYLFVDNRKFKFIHIGLHNTKIYKPPYIKTICITTLWHNIHAWHSLICEIPVFLVYDIIIYVTVRTVNNNKNSSKSQKTQLF